MFLELSHDLPSDVVPLLSERVTWFTSISSRHSFVKSFIECSSTFHPPIHATTHQLLSPTNPCSHSSTSLTHQSMQTLIHLSPTDLSNHFWLFTHQSMQPLIHFSSTNPCSHSSTSLTHQSMQTLIHFSSTNPSSHIFFDLFIRLSMYHHNSCVMLITYRIQMTIAYWVVQHRGFNNKIFKSSNHPPIISSFVSSCIWLDVSTFVRVKCHYSVHVRGNVRDDCRWR